MPAPGARSAASDLELEDYEALFARRTIRTGIRDPISAAAPLYRRLLGAAWSELPPPLQAMHDLDTALHASGTAVVERGKGWLARAVARVVGFPEAGTDVPVTVSFRVRGARETWQRTFAGRSFLSTQEEGRGRFERLLCERFGPLCFAMALVLDGGRMRLVVRGWSAFGIPMPLWLAPGGETWESAEHGRFHFHVEIGHRFTGLIVAYRGWLVPVG
jgi:hypothetical protein